MGGRIGGRQEACGKEGGRCVALLSTGQGGCMMSNQTAVALRLSDGGARCERAQQEAVLIEEDEYGRGSGCAADFGCDRALLRHLRADEETRGGRHRECQHIYERVEGYTRGHAICKHSPVRFEIKLGDGGGVQRSKVCWQRGSSHIPRHPPGTI